METNTVLLDLAVYNELREFKENMEKGNVYKLTQPYHGHYCLNYQVYSPVNYITTDEALIEILERNKVLSEVNDNLRTEIRELKTNSLDIKMSKMSIWEFIKWKKNL